MNFPTSYSPYLTNNYVYCLMNAVFVDCSVAMPYTLLITNLPVSVQIGTSFVIRVFGIQQSSIVYDNYMSIFVGLSN